MWVDVNIIYSSTHVSIVKFKLAIKGVAILVKSAHLEIESRHDVHFHDYGIPQDPMLKLWQDAGLLTGRKVTRCSLWQNDFSVPSSQSIRAASWLPWHMLRCVSTLQQICIILPPHTHTYSDLFRLIQSTSDYQSSRTEWPFCSACQIEDLQANLLMTPMTIFKASSFTWKEHETTHACRDTHWFDRSCSSILKEWILYLNTSQLSSLYLHRFDSSEKVWRESWFAWYCWNVSWHCDH